MVTALLVLIASGGLWQPRASDAQNPVTLTVGVPNEPESLEQSSRFTARLVGNLLYDHLVGLNDQMQPYPELAAQVPTLENGLATFVGSGPDRHLQVTMPLRANVTWSDGQPFTADDVVYYWGLMMNPAAGYTTTAEERMSSVDRVDDLTVRFTYLSARQAKAQDPVRYANQGDDAIVDPRYSFGLPDDPLGILPSHALRPLLGDDPMHSSDVVGLASSPLATNPIGTGSFTLAAWDRGHSLTLQSRGLDLPQRRGQPRIDTVVFQVIPDKQDLLAALQSGSVQAVSSGVLDASDSPKLDAMTGVQAQYVPGSAMEHLELNLDNPILADKSVRQAIAFGINRDALNQAAFNGKALVPSTLIPSWSWAADPAPFGYPFDPGHAQRLLASAGWQQASPGAVRQKAGQPLTIAFSTTSSPLRQQVAAQLKGQLAAIGVGLTVTQVPSDQFFARPPAAPQSVVARQFGIAELAVLTGYDPGPSDVFLLGSANVPTSVNGYAGGNYSGYHQAQSDRLLQQSQAGLERSFRVGLFHQADAIWGSDLPVLPLLQVPVVGAASTSLQNYRVTPSHQGETWNIDEWTLSDAGGAPTSS